MNTETQAPANELRLSAIEAVTPHLAAKEDVAKVETKISDLETKLVEAKSEMVRWTIGSIAVSTTLLIALAR